MSENGSKGLTIQGIDGPVNVPAGEFITNTKPRIRRMMKNHLSRGARQVYACLELATMGWQQELAVIQDKRGRRPLTTGDIVQSTELDEADVRRFLDELDGAGLAERRAADSGKLRKGKVEIYSWAFPREPKKTDSGCAHPEKIGWIPESDLDALKPLTAYGKRCRYKIPATLPDDARTRILDEAREIARALENAEKEAARFWDSVCAQATYKEERTERTFKEQPPPTSQPSIEDPVAPEPDEEPAGWPVEWEEIEDPPENLKPGDTITIPVVNLVNPPGPKEVREGVKAYLESIPRPGLTPQIVEEVSKHITTPEALEAFKVETMPAKVERGQSWMYFVSIAKRVGLDAPRYAVAKANGGNGHSPPVPKSRSELRAEAYAREVEAQEKARDR